MGINPKKVALAYAMRGLGLSRASVRVQCRALRKHIRAVYFHEVLPSTVAQFERQIRFFADHYHRVDLDDLRGLLDGRWPHDRPGILISFDDGLRGQAELAAPLLERHGLCGWFFVPGGFVDCPVEDQLGYAAAHQIDVEPEAWPDARLAMTWDQVRALDAGPHMVGCHTWDHVRLRATLTDAEREAQIPEAKRRLEAKLGHEVESFCWVGGEEDAYSAAAAAAIRDAGVELAFMTNTAPILPGTNPLHLQRSHLKAGFDLVLTEFAISGVMDAMYLPKRRRLRQRLR